MDTNETLPTPEPVAEPASSTFTPPAPPPPDHVSDAAVLPSILSVLRERRSQIGAGSEPIDLDVPGYDGALVVRYRWIPFRDLTRTSQSIQKITEPTAQTVAAASDTLVATCQEIMVRGEDGKLVPLATDDIPITFADGKRLGYALGFDEPKTAREVAIRVFHNEYALIEQASEVSEWLKDTSKKVDEEHLGE